MALGRGKYDDLCAYVRTQCGFKDIGSSGGVLLLVLNGNKGNGMSVQSDLDTLLRLPEILERVAAEIRRNGVAGAGETIQ